MKQAVIGVGLLLAGTIGLAAQRIVDAILVTSGMVTGGGFNLLLAGSMLFWLVGAVLCVLALFKQAS